jgi:hypothetical protein
MSSITKVDIKKFCEICDDVHHCWLFHKKLFEDNPRKAILEKSHAGPALHHLSVISQEYVLLQIIKLHDEPKGTNKATLSIKYILNFKDLDKELKKELDEIQFKLKEFAENIYPARNKLIAHNDLLTSRTNSCMGEFPSGDDIRYFEALHKFVNLIHGHVFGGPFPFSCSAGNDVDGLLSLIK